jgi:hypothetical protein
MELHLERLPRSSSAEAVESAPQSGHLLRTLASEASADANADVADESADAATPEAGSE